MSDDNDLIRRGDALEAVDVGRPFGPATVKMAIAALPAVTGPRPKDGWNVMQFGQVGWHVVQSADGWTVSRLFGPEILSRDDEGFSPFGPNHVANSDGGRSAAEAPADPQIATLQAEQAGLVEVLQGVNLSW